MLVSDAMTANVVTVPVDGPLRNAVELMLESDIGSVVVERGGDPEGIVTQSDVLRMAFDTGDPIESIPIEAAMSHPLVTVAPGATVRAAVRRMREAGVKRLAVTEGIDLVGIVTQSDIVRNHSLLLREAIHHEEIRHRKE